MDSLTQLALGAAVGEATSGRQVGKKALLWGAIVGTLPDLDVFVPLGNVVSDFTYHRSASHSLIVMLLMTPILAWLVLRIHPDTREHRKRWMLTIYLILASHALLDSFTAYGTQIFWPLIETPVSWSTIFIIDPLYTLWLLVGVTAALVMTRDSNRGHLVNRFGLIASSVYLGWTVVAKQVVGSQFENSLRAQAIGYQKIFTTPSPFNSLLWRAVVRDENGYYEGFYSLLDDDSEINFRYYPSSESLLDELGSHWEVQRLKWFSRGFYSVSRQAEDVVISDLRMGIEPNYVFSFKVAEISNPHPVAVTPELLDNSWDPKLLPRIWRRIWSGNSMTLT